MRRSRVGFIRNGFLVNVELDHCLLLRSFRSQDLLQPHVCTTGIESLLLESELLTVPYDLMRMCLIVKGTIGRHVSSLIEMPTYKRHHHSVSGGSSTRSASSVDWSVNPTRIAERECSLRNWWHITSPPLRYRKGFRFDSVQVVRRLGLSLGRLCFDSRRQITLQSELPWLVMRCGVQQVNVYTSCYYLETSRRRATATVLTRRTVQLAVCRRATGTVVFAFTWMSISIIRSLATHIQQGLLSVLLSSFSKYVPDLCIHRFDIRRKEFGKRQITSAASERPFESLQVLEVVLLIFLNNSLEFIYRPVDVLVHQQRVAGNRECRSGPIHRTVRECSIRKTSWFIGSA